MAPEGICVSVLPGAQLVALHLIKAHSETPIYHLSICIYTIYSSCSFMPVLHA